MCLFSCYIYIAIPKGRCLAGKNGLTMGKEMYLLSQI